uniref:hypothetical protein n=1 Tax=Citrobacter freundii TaxID=546 RepID=UPI003A5D11ED
MTYLSIFVCNYCDSVHKVTIIPRGRALGVTFFLPEGDAISASRQKLESQISTLYGG